jgi:RNA polymerase sigma factor (TIGR02999 family)
MTAGLQDQGNLDDLFATTYEELRHLALAVKGRDKSATLNPTALVHEAWLKLSVSGAASATSKLHFKHLAARAMRQVLIEAARRRNTLKRGGAHDGVLLTTEFSGLQTTFVGDELLALDRALDELTRMSPRQGAIVESRFFGGLEIAEIAELLDISEATVLRDWRAARAWLVQALRRS